MKKEGKDTPFIAILKDLKKIPSFFRFLKNSPNAFWQAFAIFGMISFGIAVASIDTQFKKAEITNLTRILDEKDTENSNYYDLVDYYDQMSQLQEDTMQDTYLYTMGILSGGPAFELEEISDRMDDREEEMKILEGKIDQMRRSMGIYRIESVHDSEVEL